MEQEDALGQQSQQEPVAARGFQLHVAKGGIGENKKKQEHRRQLEAQRVRAHGCECVVCSGSKEHSEPTEVNCYSYDLGAACSAHNLISLDLQQDSQGSVRARRIPRAIMW